jgi:aldose 1-epimerase
MRKDFGKTRDGRSSYLFTLSNRHGLEVVLCDYGATIVSIRVPDRSGHSDDIVLGYASLAEYENDRFFVGGTIGRYANRIARGEFRLNGISYALAKNAPPNHLHGGPGGFHKRLWHAEEDSAARDETLSFSYFSPDGEEGFPGNLTVVARFAVSVHRNDLRIAYEAITDRDTILNLTSHPYFNLAGENSRSILAHQLLIHADKFTPVDATMIPAGELRDVRNSPFDFARPTPIGARINARDPQLVLASGYDHNWVLDSTTAGDEMPAAQLYDPASGRHLGIFTTEPGIQFYSGNLLDGSVSRKKWRTLRASLRSVPRTSAFSRFPESAEFPVRRPEAGRAISFRDNLSVFAHVARRKFQKRRPIRQICVRTFMLAKRQVAVD